MNEFPPSFSNFRASFLSILKLRYTELITSKDGSSRKITLKPFFLGNNPIKMGDGGEGGAKKYRKREIAMVEKNEQSK